MKWLLIALSLFLGCETDKSVKGIETKFVSDNKINVEISDVSNLANWVSSAEENSICFVSFLDPKFATSDLKVFAGFQEIRQMDLGFHIHLRRDAAETLSDYQKLHRFGVHSSKIEHEFFQDFKSKNLESASLTSCNLTNSDVQSLVKSCPNLTALDLRDNPQINEKSLQQIATLKYLKELNLSRTSVRTGFQNLGALSSLECLLVSNVGLETEAVGSIAKLKGLRKLDIGKNKGVSSSSLHLLSGSQISELWIYETSVDDQVFNALIKMPELKRVYCNGCNVTETGLFKGIQDLDNLSLFVIPELKLSKNTQDLLDEIGISTTQ